VQFLADVSSEQGSSPSNLETGHEITRAPARIMKSAHLRMGEPRTDTNPTDANPTDELWMDEALRCAQRALEENDVPVGAIVVREGVVVGRGWNRNLTHCDPTAHAEIVALRDAGRNLGNHRLVDCELFATIEPCAMCAGAAVHARVRRLVYGADDAKAGAIHSVLQVVNHPSLNHQMEVRGGVLAGRAAEMLQEFFRQRR